MPHTAIPAQAGIQGFGIAAIFKFLKNQGLDSRLRGNDGSGQALFEFTISIRPRYSLPLLILRTRGWRFPQFDIRHVQTRVFQTAVHFNRHVFGGGAEGKAQGFHVPTLQKRGDLAFTFIAAVIDEGVVERFDDVLLNRAFQVGKIHHHAVFRAAFDGAARNGDFQLVSMAVQVLALAVVAVEHMRGIESKDFGDFHHFVFELF